MDSQIFWDTRQYVGQFDVSGDSNQVEVSVKADERDTTCFTHNAPRIRLGLETPEVKAQGVTQFGPTAIDAKLRANFKVSGVPYTVVPNGPTEGNATLFIPSTTQATYTFGGAVGDKFPWNIDAKAEGQPLVHGVLFIAPGSKTANGNSTAFQLPAVAAGQQVYAVLHVLSAGGTTPTLDVSIDRDAADTFGSPATVLTFAQKDGVGYEASSNATASADTWYVVNYELDGTDPDFSFVVSIGVR